jgi:hypothetical protein
MMLVSSRISCRLPGLLDSAPIADAHSVHDCRLVDSSLDSPSECFPCWPLSTNPKSLTPQSEDDLRRELDILSAFQPYLPDHLANLPFIFFQRSLQQLFLGLGSFIASFVGYGCTKNQLGTQFQ